MFNVEIDWMKYIYKFNSPLYLLWQLENLKLYMQYTLDLFLLNSAADSDFAGIFSKK